MKNASWHSILVPNPHYAMEYVKKWQISISLGYEKIGFIPTGADMGNFMEKFFPEILRKMLHGTAF